MAWNNIGNIKGPQGNTGPAGGTTIADISGLQAALDGKVASTRTVNSKALSSDVTLTQDDIGDGSTYKQYSSTDKSKLAGIASGATANSSDATLLARANHTGTQSSSTISDFASARAIKRFTSNASASTLTIDSTATDMAILTALAANLTIAAPTGTPSYPMQIMIRLKDNGTSRTLTWNAIFRAIGVTLPTATVISKTLYIGIIYNATDSKWDVIAVGAEA